MTPTGTAGGWTVKRPRHGRWEPAENGAAPSRAGQVTARLCIFQLMDTRKRTHGFTLHLDNLPCSFLLPQPPPAVSVRVSAYRLHKKMDRVSTFQKRKFQKPDCCSTVWPAGTANVGCKKTEVSGCQCGEEP